MESPARSQVSLQHRMSELTVGLIPNVLACNQLVVLLEMGNALNVRPEIQLSI